MNGYRYQHCLIRCITLITCCGRCQGVTAVTALKFILIPIVRILCGVFPFYPNRWFGIGFTAYYCLFTPILYQVQLWEALARCHYVAKSHMYQAMCTYAGLHTRHPCCCLELDRSLP